jgi:hypothetical protein
LALPPAIEPYYTQTAANSPVLLCRARVASKGEAGAGSHPGEFRLDWLPSPAIIADMYGEISPLTVEAVIRPATVTSDPELPRNQVPPPPRRRNARRSRSGSHWQERYISLEVGNADTTVERGLLHLVNWPELFGAMVRHPLGVGPDRNRLESDRWTVIIDRIWGAHDRVADAAATRGYALSHVAEVRRRDGECFGTDDLRDLNEAMSYLGSFARGSRCGATLPVAFDTRGRAAWSHWSAGWIQGIEGGWSWLDEAHPEQLAELFPAFMWRWLDPYWQRVLRLAIRYYVETNVPTTIELAVALAQVVLEMLSHSWLVVERQVKSDTEFNRGRHRTTTNIRDMLEDMGIPVAIPERLSALAAWKPRGHALDGPWAVVEIRNDMIHARPQPSSHPVDYGPRVDAWKLATWYVELAILRICGYRGVYRDRVRGEPYIGTVDAVPWAG